MRSETAVMDRVKGWNMHSVMELAPVESAIVPDRFQPIVGIADAALAKAMGGGSKNAFIKHAEDLHMKAICYRVVMNDVAEGNKGLASREAAISDALAQACVEYVLSTAQTPEFAKLFERSDADVNGVLNALLEMPRMSLSNMRKVADALGFVLIPFDYLDARSYEKETDAKKKTIERFHADLGAWFDLYAIAPLGHYSLERHVASSSELGLRVPNKYEQAFMALDMVMPILREVKALGKRVEKHEKVLTETVSRLNKLEQRIEQERIERIAAETAARNRAFTFNDPMMFALPKGSSLENDGTALIGPAWGPDLEDILLTAFGFEKNPKQRLAIERKISEHFGC